MVYLGAAGKYGTFSAMFNIWIVADLRSDGEGWYISNPEPEEKTPEDLKEYEIEEVEEDTEYFKVK